MNSGRATSKTSILQRLMITLMSLNRVYQRLHELQLQQVVINADETKCYMWVYCTGTDSPPDHAEGNLNKPPNIVLYDYQNSRRGQCVKDYLQGFSGYLQVDGYAGYQASSE